MFNDEEPIAFKKMHDFSTVDGFVEINENLADMIKFVANEPSVGLYYIQQHTQNVTPNLLNLKNKVAEKSRETALHTEDLDDSMTMLRSMKECGIPVVDEMLRDIKKSLSIISAKQPKSGLVYSSSAGFLGRTSSWSPSSWGRNAVFPRQDGDRSPSYLSSAFKSVTQRAQSFNRSQTGSEEAFQSKNEKLPSEFGPAVASTSGSSPSVTVAEPETSDSPLLNENGRELQEESQLSKSLSHQHFLALYENYDEFKADREAKLEEWLGRAGGEDQREGKKLDRGALAHRDLLP
ncbi:uncharacterized protein LOC131014806 isoform X2 [Salvia miltiorrhiza]|uniref:uncharacterized protein LOC131014806 isoform X2 n=1 Tax=Salvia miltiorrhiza TaxID=226208 RepID=UPI0025AD55BF|nr:uncharacterized protein LOC131014806 isoform X2 [Salvia miltiorrhiza]XP_057798880.1 uncharacterized protein LOC131014806 isoform X2 [Salvia miltiorrhiza]XP_057798881.1 uncharacterized protein LOC131014806 isoform X2 [Salvia miltiorrhiza]XP_057798882.1 uncharacterized protein LOC131014806 isoform X2 [Salvia miltiorrhiza]